MLREFAGPKPVRSRLHAHFEACISTCSVWRARVSDEHKAQAYASIFEQFCLNFEPYSGFLTSVFNQLIA